MIDVVKYNNWLVLCQQYEILGPVQMDSNCMLVFLLLYGICRALTILSSTTAIHYQDRMHGMVRRNTLSSRQQVAG